MSGSADAVTARTGVLADLLPGAIVRDVALVVTYALAIGVSAQIAFEMRPVPFTGQTFAVLLGAAVLGMWRGAAGTALYLGLGVLGVPWFTWAAGGATIGYIVGFVLAAVVVGWLCERGADRSYLRITAAMVVGNLLIYAVGVPWLAAVLPELSLGGAVWSGAVLFVPSDLLKIALAAALVPTTWTLVQRSR